MATKTVEIDADLLAGLMLASPGKTDREVLEGLAADRLGEDAIASIRSAFADVPQEELDAEVARAIREARHEMAAGLVAGPTVD